MIARALLIVAALAGSAAATTDAKPQSKKDREQDAKKTPHRTAPPRDGAKAAPLINLYNQWNHEWLAIDPRALPAQPEVNYFLRCHYTNKWTDMDPKLIHILAAAAQHFHSDTVDIVSGFRHPKFNLVLRKKGHQVARDSEHTHGNAVDFYIPHVTTAELHAWAKAQQIGGVGLYLDSGFVHMDTGPVRYWSGD